MLAKAQHCNDLAEIVANRLIDRCRKLSKGLSAHVAAVKTASRSARQDAAVIAMLHKAEEYRRKAEEAEARAAATMDHEAKETFLEAARQWHKLADEAERKDR